MAASDSSAKAAASADQQQQQWVTQWLSRRYRVAQDATKMLVAASYATARDMKFDPLLILAVMAIESGLNPFAELDGAQGLMQVMSKSKGPPRRRLSGRPISGDRRHSTTRLGGPVDPPGFRDFSAPSTVGAEVSDAEVSDTS